MIVPVFMYHDIKPDAYHPSSREIANIPYILTESEFRKQIDHIVAVRAVALTISDLAALASADFEIGNASRQKKVAITFDDGNASDYERAFKLFLRHGLKATFFVTTDFIGTPGYVSWDQLSEMHAGGMEIGSHSVTHPVFSALADDRIYDELARSKEIIENRLGAGIRSFSLPRGFGVPNLKGLAGRCGYSYVCNSRLGYVDTKTFAPFDIGRIAIKRHGSFREFASYAGCRQLPMLKNQMVEVVKNRMKSALGVKNYDRLRRSVLKRTQN
jgi:peptidoglycan/xylan/chitin deacetylase (PgdA/CDA1 family)